MLMLTTVIFFFYYTDGANCFKNILLGFFNRLLALKQLLKKSSDFFFLCDN